jgi:serine/threonine protein kinase
MLHSTKGMTVGDASRCPRCGTLRPTGATSLDLCPACLLTTALSIDDEPCPYQVLAPMSEDSHGVTYLALALTGARGYVALKVHGLRDDAEMILSRYQHWKPALARVQHPSVGKLLDVGLTAEGLLYVASEYVAGWPLTALSSRASVRIGEHARMAHQLIGAIGAAHAAGVVHLKLDTSKVKISTANGPHATILGLGSSLIVDGVEARPEPDLLALLRLVRALGIELPDRQYETVEAIGDAVSFSLPS